MQVFPRPKRDFSLIASFFCSEVFRIYVQLYANSAVRVTVDGDVVIEEFDPLSGTLLFGVISGQGCS